MISTRWCWGTKPKWLFPCVEWYQCQLFILLSKFTFSRWNRYSRLAIGRGESFLRFTFQLEGARGIPKVTHVFLESTLDVWKWDKWDFLTCWSSFQVSFKAHLKKSKMVITSYMLGYLMLIVYTMMSPFSTSMWIPLSLMPLMGLLSSSLLWQNLRSMFLTFLLFPTSN